MKYYSLGYSGSKSVLVRTQFGRCIPTNTKMLKTLKAGGWFQAIANVRCVGYEMYQDYGEAKYKSMAARGVVFAFGAGVAFIPVVGWGIAAGIGVPDYIWGDEFYQAVQDY